MDKKLLEQMVMEIDVLISLAKGDAALNRVCSYYPDSEMMCSCEKCMFEELLLTSWSGETFHDENNDEDKKIMLERFEELGEFDQVDTRYVLRFKSVLPCPWDEKSTTYNLNYLTKVKGILLDKIMECKND